MSDPFTVSDQPCTWQFCQARADLRYQRRGAQFCREHALLAWAVVEEELRHSQKTSEELKAERQEILKAKQQELDARIAKNSAPGKVYYLRVGEHIKIGFASNLYQRLTSYPPGTVLLAIEDGSLKLESQRHREFTDFLAHGREWFEPGDRLMSHIANLADSRVHEDYTGWEKQPAKTRRRTAA